MRVNSVSARQYYVCRSRTGKRYPNSADRRFFLEKMLDTILAAAITVAVVAILLFLIILL